MSVYPLPSFLHLVPWSCVYKYVSYSITLFILQTWKNNIKAEMSLAWQPLDVGDNCVPTNLVPIAAVGGIDKDNSSIFYLAMTTMHMSTHNQPWSDSANVGEKRLTTRSLIYKTLARTVGDDDIRVLLDGVIVWIRCCHWPKEVCTMNNEGLGSSFTGPDIDLSR